MLVSDNGFGEIGSLKDSVRKFAKAVSQPLVAWKDPKSALNVKKQWKMGTQMGKSLEKVAVDLNFVEKKTGWAETLGQKGIKAGKKGNKVAGLLGRTSEKARTNPIATTAIVTAVVVAIGKALAVKGAGAAKGAITVKGATAAASPAASLLKSGGDAATVSNTASTASDVAKTGSYWEQMTNIGQQVSKGSETVQKGSTLFNMFSKKEDELGPYDADAGYVTVDESGKKVNPALAGMLTPQNALIFLGLGALTVTGYILLNKDKS